MLDPEDDKLIQEALRDYFREEIAHPQVQAAKQKLVADHFTPAAPASFLMTPAFVFPAAALIALAVWFHQLQPYAGLKPVPESVVRTLGDQVRVENAPEPVRKITPVPETAAPPAPIRRRPRVQVKRISSGVGPTMVYQKSYRNVPVTIIWVFAGGTR